MNFPREYESLRERMGHLSTGLEGPMSAFGKLHQECTAEGALGSDVKELIALAIAITVRCDGCIAYHVHDALKAGATREQILETIGVAILMGGGPSVVYGTEAVTALEQFETAGVV
jgi:AhpD family alkylhydroperoxidase